MTCDCNHEMGDRCAKCAPTNIVPPKVGDRWGDLSPEQRAMVPDGSLLHFAEDRETCEKEHGSWPYEVMHDDNVIVRLDPAPTAAPEPDRSGWPVLVKWNGDYRWPDSAAIAVWTFGGTEWFGAKPGFMATSPFASAQAAADSIHARLPEDPPEAAAFPSSLSTPKGPDPRDAEIADLRSQVEAFRRAACVATGRGEDTTPGDSTLLSDPRATDIKTLRERAESAEATLDAYRIQRDQAREDAAGVRRLLNDAADLRAAAAEACDCDDGEVPAGAELARRLRELAREPQDLALVRRVVGIQTAALRKLISEDPTFRDIAIALAADTIDVAVGVRS